MKPVARLLRPRPPAGGVKIFGVYPGKLAQYLRLSWELPELITLPTLLSGRIP